MLVPLAWADKVAYTAVALDEHGQLQVPMVGAPCLTGRSAP
jgi:hypothetical protein